MTTLSRRVDTPQVTAVSNGPGSFGRTPERTPEHLRERAAAPQCDTASQQARDEASLEAALSGQAQARLDQVRQLVRTEEGRALERSRVLQAQAQAAVYSQRGKLAAPAPPPGSLLRACA
jgi:hypothetical protein